MANLQSGQSIHNLFWSNEQRSLGFQHFLHRRPVRYPPRLQEEFVFVLCLNGTFQVTESNTTTRITEGELFAGNSYCLRTSEYGADGPCEGLCLIVSPKLLPPNSIFEPLRKAHFLRRLAEEVIFELSANQPGKAELLEALAREFLIRATRLLRYQARSESLPRKRLLSRRHYVHALDFMQSATKNEFNVDRLSHAIGIAPSEFSRLFRESTGQTPLRVYNQLLISQADHALLNSTSIKEVAFDLGFQSPSHFTNLYRRVTGHLPSESRKMKS